MNFRPSKVSAQDVLGYYAQNLRYSNTMTDATRAGWAVEIRGKHL